MEIGVAVSYYGKIHPDHLETLDGVRGKIPVMEIQGCAYPEMAFAEGTRQALMLEKDVVVFLGHDVAVPSSAIERLALSAMETGAVVTATHGEARGSGARDARGRHVLRFEDLGAGYAPSRMSELGLAAVPLSALRKLAELDDRTYQNSAVIDTGFSKASRPFFSPWDRVPGTLLVKPVLPGHYLTPEQAFLHRVHRAGIPVMKEPLGGALRSLGGGGFQVRVRDGNAALRKEVGAPNFAVCVPVFGGWDVEQITDIITLNKKAGLTIVEVHNCPYIDQARAALVEQARALECDGVFFIDHDIIFKPGDAVELIEQAHELQDVVAAVYNMRKTAHALIGAIDVPHLGSVTFFEGGERYPALYCGLGFAAVPMAVLNALDEHFDYLHMGALGNGRPYFSLDTNGSFYSGEDVSFCGRVHGLSVRCIKGDGSPNGDDWELSRTTALTPHKIWLDSRVRIFHKGSYHYAIEDHSIAVPRYKTVEGVHLPNREAMREFIQSAADMSPSARIRSQGLDEESDHPHGTLGRGNEREERRAASGEAEVTS